MATCGCDCENVSNILEFPDDMLCPGEYFTCQCTFCGPSDEHDGRRCRHSCHELLIIESTFPDLFQSPNEVLPPVNVPLSERPLVIYCEDCREYCQQGVLHARQKRQAETVESTRKSKAAKQPSGN